MRNEKSIKPEIELICIIELSRQDIATFPLIT